MCVGLFGIFVWAAVIFNDELSSGNLPELETLLEQIGKRTVYRKLIAVYKAKEDYQKNRVTIATQGSVEYLHNLIDLTSRWDGPIAVAVYAPGDTYTIADQTVQLLKKCYPSIENQVTFSFFYPADVRFKSGFIPEKFNLDKLPCDKLKFPLVAGKVTEKYGLYPVNAGRNTARDTVKTDYVLVMDIELKPSKNLEEKFLHMTDRHQMNPDERWVGHKIVYVLPVFEVEHGEKIPTDKLELVSQIHKGKSVYFHKNRCGICHKIPYYDMWVNTTHVSSNLDIFFVTKWVPPFWEPVFIGDNKEPMYDERFKGYGSNKIQQAYEMCLQDYEFHILDNAFLVHEGIHLLLQRELDERGAIIKANYRLLLDFGMETAPKYPQSAQLMDNCRLERTGEIIGYFPQAGIYGQTEPPNNL